MIKMRNIEVAVGAFLIAGIISLLMLALQVSGLSHFFQEENGYKIQADFENIGGLKVRSKVVVAGVVVGRVTQVTLDHQSFNARVTIAIDPSKSDKFPVDTQASIMTSGLLGDNYISLVPGFSKEVLDEGGQIPIENTTSALNLEKLVSKFVANQASGEPSKGKDVANSTSLPVPAEAPLTQTTQSIPSTSSTPASSTSELPGITKLQETANLQEPAKAPVVNASTTQEVGSHP